MSSVTTRPAKPTATAVTSPTGVVRELTHVEARHLIRHPVMLAGVGLVALTIATGFAYGEIVVPAGYVLSGFALLAAHLTTSRDARDGMQDQLAALSAPRSSRTTAHLLSLGSVVLAGVLLQAGQLALLAVKPGAFDDLTLTALPHATVRIALFGAIGVLLGRWAPKPVVAPVAVVVLLFLSAFQWSPSYMWWDDAFAVWRSLVMLGLTGLAAAGALLADRRTTPEVV